MMTPKELGAFVKATRERLNIDIYLFSCKMDMSRFYLEELEKGNRRPSKRILGHIADALGIDVNEFYPANTTPEPSERPTEASGGQETGLPDPFNDDEKVFPPDGPYIDSLQKEGRMNGYYHEGVYDKLNDLYQRTQHQLLRALEAKEETDKRNRELEEMYSHITEMRLGDCKLEYDTTYGNNNYTVFCGTTQLYYFSMLIDAWNFMVGKAKESENG